MIRHLRLSIALIVVNTGLLLLAAGGALFAVTHIPGQFSDEQSRQFLIQVLCLIALGATVLVVFFNFLIGRRLSRPLRSLSVAAARIGHGDLDTPVLQLPGGEIGMLAATLEEMRRRLHRLTVDL